MGKLNPQSQNTVIVLAAIIAFVGVIVGSVYTDTLSNDAWNDRWNLEHENRILEKRIELIDETAKLIGEAPGIADLWGAYLGAIRDTTNKNRTYLATDTALSEKLAEYNGRYLSTLLLDDHYFGPKTHAAIQALSDEEGPWWEKSHQKTDALLIAMMGELYWELSFSQRKDEFWPATSYITQTGMSNGSKGMSNINNSSVGINS